MEIDRVAEGNRVQISYLFLNPSGDQASVDRD